MNGNVPSAVAPGVLAPRPNEKAKLMQSTYFSAIREQRAQLLGQFPGGCCLVVSLIGPGRQGMAGRATEVTVNNAARLIVEGSHVLASDAQATEYREAQAAARARNAPATTLDEARKQFSAIMQERSHV